MPRRRVLILLLLCAIAQLAAMFLFSLRPSLPAITLSPSTPEVTLFHHLPSPNYPYSFHGRTNLLLQGDLGELRVFRKLFTNWVSWLDFYGYEPHGVFPARARNVQESKICELKFPACLQQPNSYVSLSCTVLAEHDSYATTPREEYEVDAKKSLPLTMCKQCLDEAGKNPRNAEFVRGIQKFRNVLSIPVIAGTTT